MNKKDINELRETYIGKKFNQLFIKDIFYDEQKKGWYSICQCDCGEQCNKLLSKVTSGHTKTCGNKIHRVEQGKNHSKWLHEHWDIVTAIANNNREWYKSNKDIVKTRSANHSLWWSKNKKNIRITHPTSKIKRSKVTYKDLLPIIHNDFKIKLLQGDIKRNDIILTKCPLCGNYDEHAFHNVYKLKEGTLKYNHPPLCRKCNTLHISHYEQTIVDYIASFYKGTCIRNDRRYLNGKELDLYYPEKKIAIEFNGDYWHSEKYKTDNYHFNKFKLCYDSGILLVSIFESAWCESQELIQNYIKDLFNDKVNNFSFVDKNIINLNYPPPHLNLNNFSYSKQFYMERGNKVCTCGYGSNTGILDTLKFLTEVADEKDLHYFINTNGDLEIENKSICFHLVDLLSGDKDADARWYKYHSEEKRCVFIYPPYLNNPNKVNVYKNILLYHCGFAKRIYARNTVVKIYPAIQMKNFFIENNIEGYRNASKAYVLEDKKTNEPYMCYLIGSSYFGKGNYDCEIARGACKLGIQVIGGASKLWKHIIMDNPEIKSIVYYCDRREYDQRSIGHLMDSTSMKDLGNVYMLKGTTSFMNYWVEDVFLDNKLWHKVGDYANREPARHKAVKEAMQKGSCIQVKNPGSFTNVFVRTGYHLNGLKVVPD